MSLVDYEIGKLPEGEKKEVSKDYDVKKGDIYGAEVSFIVPPIGYWEIGGDEGIAKTIWNGIKDNGDEPLYVKVTSEWDWLIFNYRVKALFFARRLQEGTPLWVIIGLIIVLIWVIKELIRTVYYIFIEKKPPPAAKLFEIPKELILILFLILLIMILGRR